MARRWLAAVAAVVIVLSGGAASATSFPAPSPAPAPAPIPPAVVGTTVLKGEASATLNVRVPRDAVLDLTPVERDGGLQPTAMKVSGGRGHVGFLLTERKTTTGLFVVGARLPRPLVDGETVTTAVAYGQPAVADRSEPSSLPGPLAGDEPPTCTRCRIPAGDYRLQLLTSGRPTKVTISFEGLKGSKTLEPIRETYTFGMASSFRVLGDSGALGGGGGMGMGVGWGHREPGVLLSTYQLDVKPQDLPVAQSDAAACRSAGNREHCDQRRFALGAAPNLAGFGAVSGNRVREAWSEFSFGTMGDASWIARLSMLWIPTQPWNADPVASPGIAVEAGEGVEAFNTHVFR